MLYWLNCYCMIICIKEEYVRRVIINYNIIQYIEILNYILFILL